jgi:nitroreductase
MGPQPVAGPDLEFIARSARFAPNAGNRRLQPVVPVADARVLRLLRLVSPGMLPVPAAAVVVCIDWARAHEYGFRSETPGLYVDVGTTAATLLLAAHSLGIASCPVTSFSRAAVGRMLGLAEGITPQLIVCLGYPGEGEPPAMGAWVGSA